MRGQGHGHEHSYGTAPSLTATSRAGIRATKVSLVVLGVTALIQAVIVLFSGSVALLSDTLHNITDALTAIPLWIAFAVGQRAPTRRFTYGLSRTEDVAGLLIVVAIGASAVMIGWESVSRLLDPRQIEHIPWVIAAGVVGALGNELVARYRIRVGRKIGSEALVTDGQHARSDALTSLAVVAAGVGAAVELDWVDPVAGLVVAMAILWLLVQSATRILRRLLDGIEPHLLEEIDETIHQVEGVEDVTGLRARWSGHRLSVDISIAVDPECTFKEGHAISHEVEHTLLHRFPYPISAMVHVGPHDTPDAHDAVDHHKS